MKNYAYLSKGGILRITQNLKTVEKYGLNGKYVETNIEGIQGGYPAWDVMDDGKVGKNGVIVYGPDEMKVSARGKYIKVIPELAALYKQCM